MAKPLRKSARPIGGWSLPVDTEATQLLHERYSALSAQIDMGDLMLMVRAANGAVLKQAVPLDDGYEPYACAEFRAGHSLGHVLVVFPFCADSACEEGDMTDRAVSVHTMDEVPGSAVERVVRRLIDAMPILTPAPAPSIEKAEAIH